VSCVARVGRGDNTDRGDAGGRTASGQRIWDSWTVHRELIRLLWVRAVFRFQRSLCRMASPRRIVASTLTVIFLVAYAANGALILALRQPADPERLRLWLSGGMTLYAVYHAVRCAWTRDRSGFEMSPAESLWLGGGPIRRSSLAVYHVADLVIASAFKTILLAVVLAVDVRHLELLVAGLFVSLVLLEIVRLGIATWASSLSEAAQVRFRVASTAIGVAIGLQVIARMVAMTPMGSGHGVYLQNIFVALGQTAASDTVQWLAIPWVAASSLPVTQEYGVWTLVQVVVALATLPIAVVALVRLDAAGLRTLHAAERQRLTSGLYLDAASVRKTVGSDPSGRLFESSLLNSLGLADMSSVMARQWVTVKAYRTAIFFSFLIPMVLSLSPLLAGSVSEKWFFVVGGIAMCTSMLAPSALRIDFRRDLKRMLLLRSLPVRPLSMVLGQLAIPVAITWLFQLLTLAIAAAIVSPGWSSVILWGGMLSALSLFTFAVENALFLVFPHHEKAQGLAMVVRAKLTFLGKGTLMVLAFGVLALWATFCREIFSPGVANVSLIVGGIAAAWGIAMSAVFVASHCWRRFDLAADMPPQ
jgi:hypothetical protein